MALGMAIWNKSGIVLSADKKGTFPCREFNSEDIFQELELSKEVYKYYIYNEKYVIIHPGIIEGNPIGFDLFEEEYPSLYLPDMIIKLASFLEKNVIPNRKYDFFVAGYVKKDQFVYHIEVTDRGVTITCKLNSEGDFMLLGCDDIARNILYTAFELVDLYDMSVNEMISMSKNVYFMGSQIEEDLRCVKTVGKECDIISITPEGLSHQFFE